MTLPNVLVIAALLKNTKNRKVTGRLFLAICVLDALCLFMYYLTAVISPTQGNMMLHISILVGMGSYFQSCGTMIFSLLSILRHMSFRKPFWRIKTSMLHRLLVFVVIFNLIFPVAFILMTHYSAINDGFRILEIVSGLVYILIILFIFYLNITSYLIVKRDQTNTSDDDKERQKLQLKKLKGINTLLLITIFYVICCVPNTIRLIVGRPHSYSLLGQILGLLWLANNAMNSSLYLFRTSHIRKFYINIVKKVSNFL